MKKAWRQIISMFLVCAMVLGMMPVTAFAEEVQTYDSETTVSEETNDASVDVSFTITYGNNFYLAEETDELLMDQNITVPYFDLALYGLDRYYYNPDCYTGDQQTAGTKETAEGNVTIMHLYLYITEIYKCGLSPEDAGKGYLYEENLIDDLIGWTQGAGSAFMNMWEFGTNLNYYLDYTYPLGKPGWGSTCDQILLEDGDKVDVHAIESKMAFGSNFSFFTIDDVRDRATVTKGEEVTLQLWHTQPDWKDYITTYVEGTDEMVYYISTDAEEIDVDPSCWNELDYTNENGMITLDTSNLAAGSYYIATNGFEDKSSGTESAAALFTLTVEEPAVSTYLSELKFTDGNKNTSNMYEMTPTLSGNNNEYTVVVPATVSSFYAWATLSEDAPEGSSISAKWINLNNNSSKTQAITSGKTSGQSLTGAAKYGYFKNDVTIEVGAGEDVQVYTIHILRSDPFLSGLSITDAAGNVVTMNETFSSTKTSYTAMTNADTVIMNAAGGDESYKITYNGNDSNEIVLADGDNNILICVTNAEGYEKVYTVTVTKVGNICITFQVAPEDAVIDLKDRFSNRIWPNEAGEYHLMASAEYTYTVTKHCYVGQKNTFALTESGEIEITLTQAEENTSIDKTIYAQWGNFRNGDNHLGITDASTPFSPDDAELLWASKYGSGWSSAPGSPIIADDCIITYVGSSIKKLDMNTGTVVAEADMIGSSSFSIVPPTYADGMIFVGLSGGRIQAFNADTLESLWVYKDALGGQPNCPITYKDGYIYAGFWNSETANANFACVSVTDENITETTEEKNAAWTYTRAGGFYWAGAYAADKFVVVGTDDGKSGYTTEGASLLVFDRLTGKLIDSEDGIRGDMRSNVSYDPASDRVFFTTKGGILGNAKINWETGEILNVNKTVIVNAAGSENAMSTCTPSVYNGRIYIGICGDGQFSNNSGHAIGVYSLAEDGTMTQAYTYQIVGYPQTSAMVTTAYEKEDGSVYIYLPYNATPGGISVLKDKPGQIEPVTTTDSGYSEVFTPQSPLAQYAICSTIADQYGTIYYKNDSLYMMAVTSKILGIEVLGYDTIAEAEDGSITADGLEVVANLKNGLSRDISDYVTLSKDAESGNYIVSYTYGFDSDNYGLTTLTAEIEKNVVEVFEIVTQPADTSVIKGKNATVFVEATGKELTYKWYYKNPGNKKFYESGSEFVSEDGTAYSIPMYAWRDGQQVYCEITDAYGEVLQTNVVTLTLNTGSIEIVTQPQSVEVVSGENAIVTIEATGNNLTYKWYYKNPGNVKFYESGSAFVSEDGTSYSIPMASWRDGQQVYCVVTDADGVSAQSNTVTLTLSK